MKYIKQKIPELPMGELFSFKPDNEPLPEEAIREIVRYLKETLTEVDGSTPKDRLFIEMMKRELDWRPQTDRGSLTKRIKTYIRKTINKKLSSEMLNKIGAIITDNVIAPKEYNLDVTDNFEWDAGDFGDGASCFWGGRSRVRQDMMESGKYRAIRFFKKIKEFDVSNKIFYSSYRGAARAWIWISDIELSVSKDTTIKTQVYVVFNGYGASTQFQASLLSALIGLPMKSISLVNNGGSSGALYVNGTSGYVIGAAPIIKHISRLDMNTKINHCKGWE